MSSNSNVMGSLVHVLGLFTSFLGSVVVTRTAGNPHSVRNAERAVGWQATAFAVTVAVAVIGVGFPLLWALLPLLYLLNLQQSVKAAVTASEGGMAQYPYTPF